MKGSTFSFLTVKFLPLVSLQFDKEAGHVVEERKLKVLYVSPPQPPSPVLEEPDEGLSPRVFMSGEGLLNPQVVHLTY